MRQVGTSSGGAGGFGTERDAADGFEHGGRRPGGRETDLRGGRDGAGRRGNAARDAEAHARGFRDRIDDARRRAGRGPGREEPEDDAPAPGQGFTAVPERWAVESAGREGERGGGTGGSGSREPDRADLAAAPGAGEAGRDGVDRVDPGRAEPTGGGAKRLLAAAEAPPDALSALFAPPALPQPAGVAAASLPAAGGPAADGPATVERRVADIADRVERSLMADLSAAGAGAPIALRIPLDGALDGLTSLTVTATAGGLDIVLAREAGAAPSAELVAAAQNLADRLQRRLGRGAVRVFEGVDDVPAAAPGPAGWAGLSAILGRGTG